MKRIKISIVLLFLALGSFAQNKITNETEYNLSNFAQKCCIELGIDSTNILIEQYRGLIFGKYYAVSFGQNNSYIIRLSDELHFAECQDALAHELVHIAQLNTHQLTILDSHLIGFRGGLFQVNDESHTTDPQEKEACLTAGKLTNKITNKY